MISIIKIFALCFMLALPASAQILFQNGASVYINKEAMLLVNGAVQLETGSALVNNGTVQLAGDLINNSEYNTTQAGELIFKGVSRQIVLGNYGYHANKIFIDNKAGVTFHTGVHADGDVTFIRGIVTADKQAAAFVFSKNSNANGAGDASHVDGYVIKEGVGSFIFPVGDGGKYQPVDVNLSDNDKGLITRYYPADAGLAEFGTGTAETAVLKAYNADEYWEVSPIGSATGAVTIHFDDYRNSGITVLSDLRVAHKVGNQWLNEGGSATGSPTSGQVTSNSIGKWSAFTLGSISLNSPLPVSMISFDATAKENEIQLTWLTTSEVNSERFVIERKTTSGKDWVDIGWLPSQRNSTQIQTYKYKDIAPHAGSNLYRLKMLDLDGSYACSRVKQVWYAQPSGLIAYPNPVKSIVTVRLQSTDMISKVDLINASGQILETVDMKDRVVDIDMSQYGPGLYLLRTMNAQTIKVVKE